VLEVGAVAVSAWFHFLGRENLEAPQNFGSKYFKISVNIVKSNGQLHFVGLIPYLNIIGI
jgi:hypothetical protein